MRRLGVEPATFLIAIPAPQPLRHRVCSEKAKFLQNGPLFCAQKYLRQRIGDPGSTTFALRVLQTMGDDSAAEVNTGIA